MRLKLWRCWLVLAVSLLLSVTIQSNDSPVEKPDTSVFWRVDKAGQTAGYLLGTIHSEDPRVLDFSLGFIEQLTSNEVFAMEMVPDLPTLTRLMEFMHYQDGTTLENVVGADRYRRIVDALSQYRMPESQITNLKLWAAVLTLSVPPPKSGLFMDFSLSLRSSGSGMKVVGLETLEQQLSFLEAMPADQQFDMLDEALESDQNIEEVHKQMVDAYLKNDLEFLVSQSTAEMEQMDPEISAFFMEQGIDMRNERMAIRLVQLLDESTVFTAVGSLHLPGPKGLIALLRAEGFSLTPLDLPFTKEP